jgi:acetate---CoA ligase (ADP-forming)
VTDALAAMLRARSIALVGASARPGSLGARMIDEVTRSAVARQVRLVNPRYERIGDRDCVASLTDLGEPVDLALLAVPDDALEQQLRDAADFGVRSAVIFGSAHRPGLRESLRTIADDAGMAVCGAGCMGFVNVVDDLRATGYVERPVLPHGPVALVTHSGSMFSALLRTDRAIGYTVAVSSGQELVTTAADYVEYALDNTDTRVLALVLETVRDSTRLVSALRRAAASDVPVVLLPVGGSARGAELVTAHSGALAGTHGMWEALADGTDALLVRDLAELTDTLECLALGVRARRGRGIATVHDSGAERTMVVDLADRLGVPFAPLAPATDQRLQALLDDGLTAANPLDLWGRGADTRELFTAGLLALQSDPNVSITALALDLVEEYDGDRSYVDAALDAAREAPVVVLANLPCALDRGAAAELRAAGVPVLEGTTSGLVALGHLMAIAERSDRHDALPATDAPRRDRWIRRLGQAESLDAVEGFALLADYGIAVTAARHVSTEVDAVAAAEELGFPVVLKTSGRAHKTDVGGVVLGLVDAEAVRTAYRDVAARLGPEVVVARQVAPGVELTLGVVRDPQLGPLLVVAAGGVFTELLADRALALPPVTARGAERLLGRLKLRPLLDGWRGAKPADVSAVVEAIVAIGVLAAELGEHVLALDVNPLVAGPDGAVAVDVLVEK